MRATEPLIIDIGSGDPASDGVAALVARAGGLIRPGARRILGIAGPPGSGKSTLAAHVVAALAPHAALVPMDGFHLRQAELARLGRTDRKGAADTFDAAAYVALLRRLRSADRGVRAPSFDRAKEEPVPDAIEIGADVPLVVTEGNYLLLDVEPWAPVRELLDDAWYLAPEEPARLTRLVARHVAFGRPPAAARDWAHGTDQRNAALVAATRRRADVVVTGTLHLPTPPAPARE